MIRINKLLIVLSCVVMITTVASASDTLVLRRGLNGFPGFTDASIHSKGEGSHAGGSYLKCGSGWC